MAGRVYTVETITNKMVGGLTTDLFSLLELFSLVFLFITKPTIRKRCKETAAGGHHFLVNTRPKFITNDGQHSKQNLVGGGIPIYLFLLSDVREHFRKLNQT